METNSVVLFLMSLQNLILHNYHNYAMRLSAPLH
jgi:hypothetical protein